MFFKSFFKGPGRFPQYIHHCIQSCHICTNIWYCSVSSFHPCLLGISIGFWVYSLLWSMLGLHTCYRWICSFHIALLCMAPLCDISSAWICFFLFSCSSCFLDPLESSGKPTWDTCIVSGFFLDVFNSFFSSWELDCFCPVCESVDHTVLAGQIVVAIPLQILICMGRLSVYLWCYCSILLRGDKNVQEGHGTILSLFLCGELYGWAHRVYMLQELFFLVLLQYDKYVIHKSFPPSGWVHCCW